METTSTQDTSSGTTSVNGGSQSGAQTSSNGSSSSAGSPALISEDIITKAKDNVKNMNMPNMMWQQMLLELINEHPEVAEYITKYLS